MQYLLWSLLLRLLVDTDVLRVPFAITNVDYEFLPIPSHSHVSREPVQHLDLDVGYSVLYVDFAFYVLAVLRFLRRPGAMQAESLRAHLWPLMLAGD